MRAPRGLLLLHDGTLSSLAQCRALGGALLAARAAAPPRAAMEVAMGRHGGAAAALEACVPLARGGALAPPWALAVAAEAAQRPFLGAESRAEAERVLEAAAESGVDTIIACGRRTAALSIGLKRELSRRIGRAAVANVQILNPRFGSLLRERYFDAVVTPRHDGLRGKNVFQTTGALTWVNPESLAAQRDLETPQETAFVRGPARDDAATPQEEPRRLVVLLGGSTARKKMDANVVLDDLHDIFLALQGNFDMALIVCSRRTPPELAAQLEALAASSPLPVHSWAPSSSDSCRGAPPDAAKVRDLLTVQDFNPYKACLARGDAFVVTGDSVSIVSDACSTGMPVYVMRDGVDGATPNTKLWRFLEHLRARKYVAASVEEVGWAARAWPRRAQDAQDAAAFVKNRLARP